MAADGVSRLRSAAGLAVGRVLGNGQWLVHALVDVHVRGEAREVAGAPPLRGDGCDRLVERGWPRVRRVAMSLEFRRFRRVALAVVAAGVWVLWSWRQP